MYLLVLVAAWLAGGGAALTSGNGRIIVDNVRVTVSEVSAEGGTSPLVMEQDTIVIHLNAPAIGDVEFAAKGRTAKSGRAILVDLKDHMASPFKNASGYPTAFPRPGAKRVFENSRVVCWDYTWAAGVATPMHFHDKDVVVVYLADGALRSTTPDGVAVVNPHTFGLAKFNAGDRVHTETLVTGSARAIIVELK